MFIFILFLYYFYIIIIHILGKILGRHKNQCTIYMLTNSDNHLLLNEIHRQASKVPYVSADLSLTDVNYHCTLSAERILSLWDINNM